MFKYYFLSDKPKYRYLFIIYLFIDLSIYYLFIYLSFNLSIYLYIIYISRRINIYLGLFVMSDKHDIAIYFPGKLRAHDSHDFAGSDPGLGWCWDGCG